jgi:hypothetical protein
MVVYGGEGANQAGLAALNSGTLNPVTPTQPNASNSILASFLNNQVTTSLYSTLSGDSSAKINLYASAVDESTCFNDGIYFGKQHLLQQRSTLPTNNRGE